MSTKPEEKNQNNPTPPNAFNATTCQRHLDSKKKSHDNDIKKIIASSRSNHTKKSDITH